MVWERRGDVKRVGKLGSIRVEEEVLFVQLRGENGFVRSKCFRRVSGASARVNGGLGTALAIAWVNGLGSAMVVTRLRGKARKVLGVR